MRGQRLREPSLPRAPVRRERVVRASEQAPAVSSTAAAVESSTQSTGLMLRAHRSDATAVAAADLSPNPKVDPVVNPIAAALDDFTSEGEMMREECGVVGVIGDDEASRICYLGLHALQHRGQEGAGIVTSNGGQLTSITGMGLVADVFNQQKLTALVGNSAIGHVRYATAGGSNLKNVQVRGALVSFTEEGSSILSV